MSKAIDNLKGALSTAGDYIDELEVELEELEEYQSIFDDPSEARDCKDYYEEMSDIFDDTYDAQQAKELADACEWQGWDDPADVEEAAAALEQYRDLGDFDDVQEAVHNSGAGDERVAELEKQIERLQTELDAALDQVQRGIELEDQRILALTVLGGIDKVQADIDLRKGTELAYESGLSDGIIAQAASASPDHVIGEQGIVDPALLEDDEA